MKRIFCIIALVSLFGLAVLGCDKQLSTSASEMIVNNTTANKQSESEKVESDKSSEKGEGVEDNETTEYLDYSDYKNDIDDIMVVRVNDAGMNGSQASLRENEDIFCEAWTNEYKSIIDHIIKKCKKKEDKKK